MSYHIEEKAAMRIVGIRTPLAEDMETNLRNLPDFWQQSLNTELFKKICEFSQREPKGILGISVYQDPDNIFYYIASSTNDPVPEGMYEYEIPAATWVIFENDGPFKENVQSVISSASIQSGFHFRVMSMRACQTLRFILLSWANRSMVIRRYGLPSKRKRRTNLCINLRLKGDH